MARLQVRVVVEDGDQVLQLVDVERERAGELFPALSVWRLSLGSVSLTQCVRVTPHPVHISQRESAVTVSYCCVAPSERVRIGLLGVADIAAHAANILGALSPRSKFELIREVAEQLVEPLSHALETGRIRGISSAAVAVLATAVLGTMMYVAERLGVDPYTYLSEIANLVNTDYVDTALLRELATQAYPTLREFLNRHIDEIRGALRQAEAQTRYCPARAGAPRLDAAWLLHLGDTPPLPTLLSTASTFGDYVASTSDGVAFTRVYTSRQPYVADVSVSTDTARIITPWIPIQPEAYNALKHLHEILCKSDAHTCSEIRTSGMYIAEFSWHMNPRGVIHRDVDRAAQDPRCVTRTLLVYTPTYLRTCSASCGTCTGERRRATIVTRVLHDIECFGRNCTASVVGRNNNPVYVYVDPEEGADLDTAKQLVRAYVAASLPNNTYLYARYGIEYECSHGACAPIHVNPAPELRLSLAPFAGNRVRYSCSRGEPDVIFTDARGVPYNERGERLPLDRQCMYDFIAARLQQIEFAEGATRETHHPSVTGVFRVPRRVTDFIGEYGDEMLSIFVRRGKISSGEAPEPEEAREPVPGVVRLRFAGQAPVQLLRNTMYVACYRDWAWYTVSDAYTLEGVYASNVVAMHQPMNRFRCYLPTLYLRRATRLPTRITINVAETSLSGIIETMQYAGYRTEVRWYTRHALRIFAYRVVDSHTVDVVVDPSLIS